VLLCPGRERRGSFGDGDTAASSPRDLGELSGRIQTNTPEDRALPLCPAPPSGLLSLAMRSTPAATSHRAGFIQPAWGVCRYGSENRRTCWGLSGATSREIRASAPAPCPVRVVCCLCGCTCACVVVHTASEKLQGRALISVGCRPGCCVCMTDSPLPLPSPSTPITSTGPTVRAAGRKRCCASATRSLIRSVSWTRCWARHSRSRRRWTTSARCSTASPTR
jgi:hypothetical protein